MWMTNFLTFNSRAILIYATCLLDCPWVYLLMEIVVYNVLYITMHTRHEDLCAHMAACLETAAAEAPVRASARPTTTSSTARPLAAIPRPTSRAEKKFRGLRKCFEV